MAAFSSLTDRLSNAFKHLKSKGKLSDADIDGTIREIRRALLDADVSLDVVRSFTARVRDRALSTEVSEALNPAQQVVRIVNDELTDSLGQGVDRPLNFAKNPPTIIMLAGLQGAGKTTLAGKLGYWLKDSGHTPLLVAADLQRPNAVTQLEVVGERAGVPVVKRSRGADPASVCYDVLDEADAQGADLVLIDTAGRLHTSAELMRELAKVVNVTRKRAEKCKAGPMPVHVVLVIDAGTGQNGLNQAVEFNEALGLDGIILTKLDGTAKGGIALAVSSKLGLPIYRVGVGEGIEDLQEFNAHDFCRALVGE